MTAQEHAAKIAALQDVAAGALNELSRELAAAGLPLNSPLQFYGRIFRTEADGLALQFEPEPVTAADIQDEESRRALQDEAARTPREFVCRKGPARFIDISAKSRPAGRDKKVTPGTAPQGDVAVIV